MTRVALVTYDDTPPHGGQGVYVREMRTRLEARGTEIVTLAGRGDHAIPYPTVLRRAPLDFSLHLNRHPELIRALGAEVIHLQSGPGGALLTRSPPAPMIITAHHTYRQAYSVTSPRRVLGRLEALCYRRAERILAVSPSTATAIRAMGIRAAQIEVLPPGIDCPEVDETRRVPGRVLFVGRMEPEKGPFDAVSVMAALAAGRNDVTGHVVGRGSLSERVRAACGRAVGVTFVGAVDDNRLAREYAEAEVVLVPSRYEGLGLVALEAMAAGAVVAGYDVVGLRDAALGVAPLVPAGDVRGLREATEAVLDDTRHRTGLARRGREAVAANHSWDRHIGRLIEVYAEVAGGV